MRTVRDTHVELSACGSTYRWRYVLTRVRPFAVLARLVLLAVLLPVHITEAQPDLLNETWRWARYGTESGLPSGHVLDLVETSNGVSWTRTQARLAWYDAYQWHPVGIEEEAALRLPTRPEATTASFQIAPPFYRHPLFLAAVLLWLLSMIALCLSYWRRHRRSEERFSKVFHASPMAIAIASLDEGRLLEINESFEKFFGYARSEVIGKTTRELNLWHDPDTRTLLMARIKQGEVLGAGQRAGHRGGVSREDLWFVRAFGGRRRGYGDRPGVGQADRGGARRAHLGRIGRPGAGQYLLFYVASQRALTYSPH